MTMPTFEPVAYINLNTKQLEYALPTIFHVPETINLPPVQLFTESQLQQAYEAGLRDAVPEGYTLVPNDPEGQWSNPDLINIMVDAFNDAEGGKYDSMLAAYKAMLAAAPKGD